ncbi:unnamed protein product, partial [Arabidopsis halleri]
MTKLNLKRMLYSGTFKNLKLLMNLWKIQIKNIRIWVMMEWMRI